MRPSAVTTTETRTVPDKCCGISSVGYVGVVPSAMSVGAVWCGTERTKRRAFLLSASALGRNSKVRRRRDGAATPPLPRAGRNRREAIDGETNGTRPGSETVLIAMLHSGTVPSRSTTNSTTAESCDVDSPNSFGYSNTGWASRRGGKLVPRAKAPSPRIGHTRFDGSLATA